MKTAVCTLVLFTFVSGRAAAVLIVDDDFDSYEGQAEFEAVWTPIGTVVPVSAALAADQVQSPPQSVFVPGTSDPGRYRNELTFTPTPLLSAGDQLVWSFDFYDRQPIGHPRSHFVSLQTAANPGASPAGQVLSLGLNSNQLLDQSGGNSYMASISGYAHESVDPEGGSNEDSVGTGAGAFFKLNDSSAGLRGEEEGWRNLKLVISTADGITLNHAYFVNDVLAETVSNVGPNTQYSVMRLGSGLGNAGLSAYYDNVRLEFIQGAAVPEAGALGAMGVVGLMTAGAVWLRRKRAQVVAM